MIIRWLLIFLIGHTLSSVPAFAEKAPETVEITEDTKEIVKMMELLDMLELLEDLPLMENMDLLDEGESNDSQN